MEQRCMDVVSPIKAKTRSLCLMCLAAFTLSGCMVGPDFHKPPAPDVKSFNANPLPAKTASAPTKNSAGNAQTYVYNQNIPADWWEIFHSDTINQLVQTGINNSPNITAAQAALRNADEIYRENVGNLLFPAVNLSTGGTRQRFAGANFGSSVPASLFNIFNVTASISYTLDVFGGSRRQLEALSAQVNYQEFQLLATYLTLSSNIVTTAFTIASYEAQIKATNALIAAEQGQLDIIRKQYQLGGVAGTNVLTQQTLVDQTRATLPPLQKSLSQARHAMDVLLGNYPDTPVPSINLDKLQLPKTVPVSLTSNLVRQRPDVRASEALLHAASAQIGVATANLFPSFTLNGNYGWTGAVPSNIFAPINKAWLYGGAVTQPLFHGGALLAARSAAIDAYDQALAQYKQTLLQAFQNTADALRAIETDARTFKAAKAAENAAYRNYKITSEQYRDGGVSYLNLLTAQQQYQQTVIASVQAQAQRYADTAALYQALGGGWWNRKQQICKDTMNPKNASLTCP